MIFLLFYDSYVKILHERIKMHKFSLHTHTTALDGYNTVSEMVCQAERIGYQALGFSEHFIVFPNIEKSMMYEAAKNPKNKSIKPYHQIYSSSFDEAIDTIKPVYEQIDNIQLQASIPLYKGLEVDFFDYNGWEKGFEHALSVLKPDYVIGACHFSVYEGNLLNMHDILRLSSCEQKKVVKEYWQRQQDAIKSGHFDFMAHLDLYKRHGIGTSSVFFQDEQKTVETLSEFNVGAEINTSSLNKKDYKISDLVQFLKLISQFNIPTLLSDDAHHVSQLGQNYETVISFAKKNGVKCFCRPVRNGNIFMLKKIIKENQR